jgi:hypothetical protein
MAIIPFSDFLQEALRGLPGLDRPPQSVQHLRFGMGHLVSSREPGRLTAWLLGHGQRRTVFLVGVISAIAPFW